MEVLILEHNDSLVGSDKIVVLFSLLRQILLAFAKDGISKTEEMLMKFVV